MRRTLLALLVVAYASACGKAGENAACNTDADCEDGLRCALLQGGDGAKREMCVNPNGAWDMSASPKSQVRRYAVPVGGGGAALVLLLVLRARAKRKRARREHAAGLPK